MKKIIAIILIASGLFSACNEPMKNEEPENVAVDTVVTDTVVTTTIADNSKNSLDWTGIYSGVVPCADCKGIETSLTIDSNSNFTITRKYLGKSDKVISNKGKFDWNETGNKITLATGNGVFMKFLVGENHLILLDSDGNEITGTPEVNYKLNKQTLPPFPTTTTTTTTVKESKITPPKVVEQKAEPVKKSPVLFGVKWELVELAGKPIAQDSKAKVIYIMLDSTDKRIYGFGGCNQFFGEYQITEPLQIKFKKMTTTMMACDKSEFESHFIEIFESADNYSMNQNNLSLNKAKMAPLARFEVAK